MQERGRLIAGSMSLSRWEGIESGAQETRPVRGTHISNPEYWAPVQTCGQMW